MKGGLTENLVSYSLYDKECTNVKELIKYLCTESSSPKPFPKLCIIVYLCVRMREEMCVQFLSSSLYLECTAIVLGQQVVD